MSTRPSSSTGNQLSHAKLCEEAAFGRFVSSKVRVSFVKAVNFQGEREGKDTHSLRSTLLQISERFNAKLESYCHQFEISDEVLEGPPTPGRETEWMRSESYPQALAAITEFSTVEKDPEFLTEDEVGWNGELGYTGSLWGEWVNEED